MDSHANTHILYNNGATTTPNASLLVALRNAAAGVNANAKANGSGGMATPTASSASASGNGHWQTMIHQAQAQHQAHQQLLASKNPVSAQQQLAPLAPYPPHRTGAEAAAAPPPPKRIKLTTQQKLDKATQLHKAQMHNQRMADQQQAQAQQSQAPAPPSQLSSDMLLGMIRQQQGQRQHPLQPKPAQVLVPSASPSVGATNPDRTSQQAQGTAQLQLTQDMLVRMLQQQQGHHHHQQQQVQPKPTDCNMTNQQAPRLTQDMLVRLLQQQQGQQQQQQQVPSKPAPVSAPAVGTSLGAPDANQTNRQAPATPQLTQDMLVRLLQQQQGQQQQQLQPKPAPVPVQPKPAPAPVPSPSAPGADQSNLVAAALLRQAFSVEQLQTIMEGLNSGNSVQQALASVFATKNAPSAPAPTPTTTLSAATNTIIATNTSASLNGDSAMAHVRHTLQEAHKLQEQQPQRQQQELPTPTPQDIAHQEERQRELTKLQDAQDKFEQVKSSLLIMQLAQNKTNNGTDQNLTIPAQFMERANALMQQQPPAPEEGKEMSQILVPAQQPSQQNRFQEALQAAQEHYARTVAQAHAKVQPRAAAPPLPAPVVASVSAPATPSVDVGNLLQDRNSSSNGTNNSTSNLLQLLQAHAQQQQNMSTTTVPLQTQTQAQPAMTRESLEAVLAVMQQQQQPQPVATVSSVSPNPAPVPSLSASSAKPPVAAATVPLLEGQRKRRRGRTGTFPQKMHQMLEDMEIQGTTDIVSFLENSNSFAVHQPTVFARDVMPKYFKMGSYASFQRQLNLYDFIRIDSGKDRGAYHHPLFLRGKPLMSTAMRRTKTKGHQAQSSGQSLPIAASFSESPTMPPLPTPPNV